MKTKNACSTPPSASPSPTPSLIRYNPCNAIKVKTIPSLFSNNLAYGSPFNSDSSEGSSQSSQFFNFVPPLVRVLNASTCGLTTMDTFINVYSCSNCHKFRIMYCSNDDGCADPSKRQSTVSFEVLTGVPYSSNIWNFSSLFLFYFFFF